MEELKEQTTPQIETYTQLIESANANEWLESKVGTQLFQESEVFPIKLIAPGWGSSGYYSESVLKRDGAKAWPKGTHMYINHQSMSERVNRPERDLRNLAAVTITDPVYQENGSHGAGLYAQAEVFSSHAPFITERAKHIGVSITADGIMEYGEAEGRKGNIIKEISNGYTVDFVTKAGAGGAIISESSGGGYLIETTKLYGGDPDMAENNKASAELDRLMAENVDLRKQLDESTRMIAILQKAQLMSEARRVAVDTIQEYQLPATVNSLIVESAITNLPLTESGDLNGAQLVEAVKERAEKVRGEVSATTSSGVVGFGEADNGQSVEAVLNETVKNLVKISSLYC